MFSLFFSSLKRCSPLFFKIFLLLIYFRWIYLYFLFRFNCLNVKMSGVRARCPPRSRTEPLLWWRARGSGRGPSSAEPSCPNWSRPSPWLPTRTSPWGSGWPRTRTCPRARYRWVRCSGLWGTWSPAHCFGFRTRNFTVVVHSDRSHIVVFSHRGHPLFSIVFAGHKWHYWVFQIIFPFIFGEETYKM